ncbi:hypothetical protein OHB31_30600 [Streptomyces microflavus]|uniref:hypothetical protein n=1 Tax=Streptomyces microflavus TaxID=1919 RepID=UPI0022517169|nr:hypothetical protein [Streptomyces microflavus]MCX4656174.1 hypothetical protein [Streptomyces microflavus]WSA65555.1 hypothetical protein OHB31_30600 [Streptomyces microflavus]
MRLGRLLHGQGAAPDQRILGFRPDDHGASAPRDQASMLLDGRIDVVYVRLYIDETT